MREITSHLDTCEGCREERRRFQELSAALESMEASPVEPPAWLLASITENTLERLRRMAAIKARSRQLGEHKVATASGAAILLGVAGALVVGRSRRRSRRLRVGSLTGIKVAA